MRKWVVAGLAAVVAAWFAFDGALALVTGDYVSPSSGPHAGELGPWSRVVARVGVEPHSTAMKVIFLTYGLAWIGVIWAFVAGRPWARTGMLIAAIGSLWYLPFGTLLGLVQISLLVLPAARDAAP